MTGQTALTQLLSRLPIPTRVKYRRRIEALTNQWARRLDLKYGRGATSVVKRLMVNSARRGDHFRNHLWARIYRSLNE